MNTDIATGYSNPFEPFEEAFRISWMRALYAHRIRAFLDLWASDLASHSEGLDGPLGRFADRLPNAANPADPADAFDIAWHPFCNLAPIAEADTGSFNAALARAMQFVLRLAAFEGVDAAVRLTGPVSLGFGSYRLPLATEVRLTSAGAGRRIDLRTANGWIPLNFERQEATWILVSGNADRLPTVSLAGQSILLFPLTHSIQAPDENVIPPDPTMAGNLQLSLNLIERLSPAYCRWIERMLRVVVPLQPVFGRYDSESFAALNGTAFLSLHPDVIRTAETLVHEVSHDYLHVLNSLDPLTDPSGAETFFSPVKQCERPTIGILKAQHAFVNVLIFYYLLEMSGVPLTGPYVRGVERLESWRRDLEASLSQSRTLTELGDCLWRPLARRADQFRMLAHSVRESRRLQTVD